jgi:hypothetical protein
MLVKVKSSVFIDALQLELSAPQGNDFRGVLKDDAGCVCRVIEKKLSPGVDKIVWSGLNDLPYGRYTLEFKQGEDEVKLNLVKRV